MSDKLAYFPLIIAGLLLISVIIYRTNHPFQSPSLVTDIEDGKTTHEFFAHDNTVKCVTWCVNVGKYKCFGQCLPILIRNENGHDTKTR